MPRNMSFAKTTDQMHRGLKDVTRRDAWKDLESGTILTAVEKAMGLKPGETIKRIRQIKVVSVRREAVVDIIDQPGEALREGFPQMTEQQFAEMFCRNFKVEMDDSITRIEFKHGLYCKKCQVIKWYSMDEFQQLRLADGLSFCLECVNILVRKPNKA